MPVAKNAAESCNIKLITRRGAMITGQKYIWSGLTVCCLMMLLPGVSSLAQLSPARQNDSLSNIQALVRTGDLKLAARPKAALQYYQQALNTTQTKGMLADEIFVLTAMIQANKKMSNYKNAWALTEQRQTLRDSLFRMNKAKEIAALASVYQLDKTNREVRDLKRSHQKEVMAKRGIIIVAIILSIALSGALFFYRHSRQLNHRLNLSIARLRQSEENLRISNNLKEQYYSLLSHDLKSPLKYMKLALGMLRDNLSKYTPDALQRNIAGLYTSADKVHHLTESFISWIRSNDTSLQTEITDTNIPLLLENITAIYRHAQELQYANISIAAPPDLVYKTDPNLMHIILRNVVDNALKHGNAHNICLSARQNANHSLQVQVSNNGAPIPPEVLSRLNNTDLAPDMHALDNHQSLGFQIIRVLTQKLCGTYHISSSEESGTNITFTFNKHY